MLLNRRRSPARTVKRVRAGSTMVTFWSWMGGARTNTFTVRVPAWQMGKHYVQVDEVPHLQLPFGCWSIGILTYLCARFTRLGNSLQGSPALDLVLLGYLVVLICGLLFALSSRAVHKLDHRRHAPLLHRFCSWGQNCWIWRAGLRLHGSLGTQGRDRTAQLSCGLGKGVDLVALYASLVWIAQSLWL